MEELKGSLLPPNKDSYNKRDRSEPDESVIKRIRRQPSELIKEIKNLSEWIDENNCDTLNKGNKVIILINNGNAVYFSTFTWNVFDFIATMC